MLYPVMPVYLKQIGFSVLLIGILEGIAEATAGLSKGYFGKVSDLSGRRLPFVQWGYALSAISKPMMSFFVNPLWIFFSRTTDRLGKGLRTAARDALLSDEATPQTKGKVFGFHRAMDTFGAALGPAIALIYLYYNPKHYLELFIIAFIPGVLSVLATFLLKEKKTKQPKAIGKASLFSFFTYWKTSPQAYKKLVTGLLLFALFNSSDIFLLLKLKQANMNDTYIIGAYIFYNLIYALFAFPLGMIADKIGLKKTLLFGLSLFAIVYSGMALTNNITMYFVLFFIYGLYAASTEGITKAWISNISDKKDTATAIGTFAGFQSICTMIASSLTGLIWFTFGAQTAFFATSILTVVVIFYLAFNVKTSKTTIDLI